MGGKAINPTPIRGIRVDDDLWERFDEATKALGTTRSAWLQEAIRWCVHEAGAKTPKRPKIDGYKNRTDDTEISSDSA